MESSDVVPRCETANWIRIINKIKRTACNSNAEKSARDVYSCNIPRLKNSSIVMRKSISLTSAILMFHYNKKIIYILFRQGK